MSIIHVSPFIPNTPKMLFRGDVHINPMTMYSKTPYKALEHLKDLWERQRGALVEEDGELHAMLSMLSASHVSDGTWLHTNGGERTAYPMPQVDIWKAGIANDLPILLFDMIEDKMFAQQPFAWVQMLIIATSNFASMWIARAHPKAAERNLPKWPYLPPLLVKTYFGRLRAVWNTLWNNIHMLLPDSDNSVFALNIVGNLVQFAGSVTYLHTDLYPEYVTGLVTLSPMLGASLAAWTRATTSKKSIAVQYDLPFQLLCKLNRLMCTTPESPTHKIDSAWRSTIDTLIERIGAKKFMRACHTALSSCNAFTGPCLQNFLWGLTLAVASPIADAQEPSHSQLASPTRDAFLSVPMLPAIAEALDRHSRACVSSPPSKDHFSENTHIFGFSCDLLNVVMTGLRESGEEPSVADGRSAYRIISCIMLMLARLPKAGSQENATLVTRAVDRFCYECDDMADLCLRYDQIHPTLWPNLRRVTQEIMAAIYLSWYLDLRQLRALRSQTSGNTDYNKLVDVWIRLGSAVRLTETSERDRCAALSKQLCSWVQCCYYYEPCPKALSACAGCREQRYCSRECQKSDWKRGGHRDKCREAKA